MQSDHCNCHYIIGTAGHVDHGKTTLIKALTGIDTDRLSEEKARKITIDLGFAYIDLPGFNRVGIVDVPGHEKFIKNMLAGAGGMDICLMVIAADEGICLQTREHLDILKLLDISLGVIALTKSDLVSEDDLIQLSEAICEEVKGTFLEGADIVPVSSVTGLGLDELRSSLTKCLQSKKLRDRYIDRVNSPFYMPIDRAFTIKGFGTVVTGSVMCGSLSLKDCDKQKYVISPSGREVMIRNLQVHSEDVEEISAGQRSAVNLRNIAKDEIGRGQCLMRKEDANVTMMLDVKLSLLESSPFCIKNNSTVHLYYGTGEYIAKVVLMDREVLSYSETCYAQLRLKEPITAENGGRFVVRFFSPVVTVGGGIIIDSCPEKKRRGRMSSIRSFEVREHGSSRERAYEKIITSVSRLATRKDLDEDAGESVDELIREGEVIELDNGRLISSLNESKIRNYYLGMLASYHKSHPDYPGLNLSEARFRVFGNRRDRDSRDMLSYWKAMGYVKEEGASISLKDFVVTVPEDDILIRNRLIALYREAGMNPPAYNEVKPTFMGSDRFIPVLKSLIKEGCLIKLDERYIIYSDCVNEAGVQLEWLAKHRSGGIITLGDFRDRIKGSRKVALALLEYFDRKGITKKTGDERIMVGK